jgi:hypothetical protein
VDGTWKKRKQEKKMSEELSKDPMVAAVQDQLGEGAYSYRPDETGIGVDGWVVIPPLIAVIAAATLREAASDAEAESIALNNKWINGDDEEWQAFRRQCDALTFTGEWLRARADSLTTSDPK